MPTKAGMIFSQLKADLAQVRALPRPRADSLRPRQAATEARVAPVAATRTPRCACGCDPGSSARLSAPARPQITGSAIQKSYPPALPSQGKFAPAPVPPQMPPPAPQAAQAPPFPQAPPMMSMHPAPQASTVACARVCRTAGGQRTDCSVHAATAVADARAAGTSLPYLSRACACALSATALCPDMQDSWALTPSRRSSRRRPAMRTVHFPCLRAIAHAPHRIGQSALASAHTLTPGSRTTRPFAGKTAATGSTVNSRPVAVPYFKQWRAGRPGPVAAWPGARVHPCLRVAPKREAGPIMGKAA